MQSARHLRLIAEHQTALTACTRCADMHKPVVVCGPVLSPVLLVGQAPGDKEPALGRPFAWTAGRQLFKWFEPVGLAEAEFRARVYMAAVCRCFPGKNPKGGDRVPAPDEIANCRPWLDREIELLRPDLILAVGRLAIEQFLPPRPLVEQVGVKHRVTRGNRKIDLIPLPHPSGRSTWLIREENRARLDQALGLISASGGWKATFG